MYLLATQPWVNFFASLIGPSSLGTVLTWVHSFGLPQSTVPLIVEHSTVSMYKISPRRNFSKTLNLIPGPSRKLRNPSGVFKTTAHPSAVALAIFDDGVIDASANMQYDIDQRACPL
jgi:hypothetical protein